MTTPLDVTGAAFSDSLLSRKFGPETINYFSGSPLNRVSFLRSNTAFLSAALPVAKFLLLKELDPLAISAEHLAFVTYDDVKDLVGNPYELEEEKYIEAYDSRIDIPTLLFLGLDENENTAGFSFKSETATYAGQPFFAIDVTPRGGFKEKAEALVEKVAKEGREFRKTRLDLKLVPSEAAIMGQARSLLDWNARNSFCSACGARTLSVHAGTKRVCPSYDKAFQKNLNGPPEERPSCISRTGVHNIAFPRTDPTVIMAIINHAGDKVLLGRGKRWPKDFYSCLAGFCEPAESIEEAVRRETWEESGVRVGRVVIHSTQPWPYPSSLMIGAIGEAVDETIHLGHDPELQNAKWFTMAEIEKALPQATGLTEERPPGVKEGDLRVPPATAIAHQLMKAVINNFQGASAKI